jgi:hypothetical protein
MGAGPSVSAADCCGVIVLFICIAGVRGSLIRRRRGGAPDEAPDTSAADHTMGPGGAHADAGSVVVRPVLHVPADSLGLAPRLTAATRPGRDHTVEAGQGAGLVVEGKACLPGRGLCGGVDFAGRLPRIVCGSRELGDGGSSPAASENSRQPSRRKKDRLRDVLL